MLYITAMLTLSIARPFSSCFEPHCESEARCKVVIMKNSFYSYANKTNFNMKSFVLSLAFIMRLAATRKWPIENQRTDASHFFLACEQEENTLTCQQFELTKVFVSLCEVLGARRPSHPAQTSDKRSECF